MSNSEVGPTFVIELFVTYKLKLHLRNFKTVLCLTSS